jgi:heme/copper-type cytochrome/quinol oxidase subunit 2
VLRDGNPITPEVLRDLRAAGVKEVRANLPFYWDLVCEELCGQGHYTMQGRFIVLEDDQLAQEPYTKFFKRNEKAEIRGRRAEMAGAAN